ncbi:Acyl-CoA N-acyltransferase [Mycena sanguinolenta]|uniref:Acyl-CoA N-acyltransferase n=1 Tax=Mycena sanguinolenta TaxID=230812 RepID=A0A8H6X4B2_9AGAR|nr:Acyl-CoA N-acyltransferase [Mycena sanguinolenta]
MPPSDDLRVELITDAADFEPAFICLRNAFGHQTHDGIWAVMYPGWDTPEGVVRGARELADRWTASRERGNVHFLKATLAGPGEERIIGGMAIWVHATLLPGHGEVLVPPADFTKLYPDNEPEARYARQLLGSLFKHRFEALKEKARPESLQKSAMVLDLLAVDPAFQRKGAASRLTQWGLDEAQRLGGIESMTEGSAMGRLVYKQMGFREVQAVEYDVDEEFKARERPSNVFMRTGSA